ncbi:hypothetical protein B0H15DRAFT_927331 [Mycena belliarum]|uniref:HMG box domain-containing protein n=1 Tax=Mycena belliarum TaxID=1033014 RepID=A0AAD6UIU3_9AGAR|nr:hypothetical protein B0H15DRAFT_927331 [Mycena belliae]
MFSILPARLLSRLGTATAPLAVARQLAAPSATSRGIFASATRRTFLTSARLSFPAAKAAASQAKTTKKAPAKTASKVAPKKKATVTKKAAPKKKVVKKKVLKKKPAPKPKRKVVKKKAPPKPLRITKAMGPPTRGVTAFIAFMQEWAASPAASGLATLERAKNAGAAWRALSDAEKQPYVARSKAIREAAKITRDKWFTDADPALLRRINKTRKEKKLPRILNPTKDKKPTSNFIRFMADFRQTLPSDMPLTEKSRQGGAVWRAMTAAEKEPYNTAADNAMAAYRAAHPAPAKVKA